MAKVNDVHSVIVPAQSPNLSGHSYTEVYGGTAGCAIVINGVSVNIGPTSSIFINITTVSGGNGCYLLGIGKDVYQGYIGTNNSVLNG